MEKTISAQIRKLRRLADEMRKRANAADVGYFAELIVRGARDLEAYAGELEKLPDLDGPFEAVAQPKLTAV